MFYTVEMLTKRKNRKGRLPFCWLAATSMKSLKKKEIEKVDVGAACDDIINGLTGPKEKGFSLRTASQLTFGALLIFQKQVDSLEEECKELYKNILEDKYEPSQQPSIPSPREKTQQDVIDLLSTNRVDVHQIIDVDPPRPSHFGELSFFHDQDPTLADVRIGPAGLDIDAPIPDIQEMDFEMFEAPNVQAEPTDPIPAAGPEPDTFVEPPPSRSKRKSRRPHDETPTKRRPGDASTPGTPRTPSHSRTGIPSTVVASPSETAKSPSSRGPRRSLLADFTRHAPTADASMPDDLHPQAEMPENFVSLIGDPKEIADRFSNPTDSYMPMRPVVHFEEPMDIVEKQQDFPATTAEESRQDIDQMPPPLPQDDAPVQDVVPVPRDDSQPPPAPLAQPSRSEDFSLEELDDVSLDSQSRRGRRRSKKIVTFDERKQITISMDNIFDCTREKVKMKMKKSFMVSAKELLSMPSTGLKMISNLENKRRCTWATVLLEKYNDATVYHPETARPTSRASRRFSELDVQRTNGRRSEPSRSTTSDETGQRRSDEQAQDVNDIDQMPPPPLLPSNAIDQQRPPRVSSPRDERESANRHVNDVPEFQQPEFEDFPEVPQHQPHLDDVHQQQQSHIRHEPTEPEGQAEADIPLIDPKDKLRQKVEQLWMEAHSTEEDEEIKIKLDVLLPPSRTTVLEFIASLLHLNDLEKNNVLCLSQDEPYKTIFVGKPRD